MTKKLLFAGCSYTAGNGWTDTDPDESAKIEVKDSPHLWVNLCHDRIDRLSQLDLINVGRGGASNTDIFQNTVRQMIAHGDNIDTVICQWTSGPRYNWNVGFELWNTSEGFTEKEMLTQRRNHDINLNRGDHWPRDYIDDLTSRMMTLHHLHWEVLKVVDYANMIYCLAQQLQIPNVFFVNGLCIWDDNYFTKLQNAKPESYTEFTKKEILNIDTRDDADILELYNLAHQHYEEAGGVAHLPWINLYGSFHHRRIDTNFDNSHPGVESNLLYYNLIQARLQELAFI